MTQYHSFSVFSSIPVLRNSSIQDEWPEVDQSDVAGKGQAGHESSDPEGRIFSSFYVKPLVRTHGLLNYLLKAQTQRPEDLSLGPAIYKVSPTTNHQPRDHLTYSSNVESKDELCFSPPKWSEAFQWRRHLQAGPDNPKR